eukprot:UC1_evm4s1611
MSGCPLGYGGGSSAGTATATNDASVQKSILAFDALLQPDCTAIEAALRACRKRVATAGHGHCADAAATQQSCRAQRERERARISAICVGGGEAGDSRVGEGEKEGDLPQLKALAPFVGIRGLQRACMSRYSDATKCAIVMARFVDCVRRQQQ